MPTTSCGFKTTTTARMASMRRLEVKKLKPFLKDNGRQQFGVAGMRTESVLGESLAAVVIEHGDWRFIKKGEPIPRERGPAPTETQKPDYAEYTSCLYGPNMSLLLSEQYTPTAEEWKTLCETAMNSDGGNQVAPLIDALIQKIPHNEAIRIFTFAMRESPNRHESWRGRPLIDFALANPNPSSVMTIIYKAYHIATALRKMDKMELFKEAKRILDRLTYRVYLIWGKFRCDVIYGLSNLKFFDSMNSHDGWKNSISETGALWDLQRNLEEKGRVFANRMNFAWDERVSLLQIPVIGQWVASHLANSKVVFSGHDMDKILNSAWTVSSIDMVQLLVDAINSRNENCVQAIWHCLYWGDHKPESSAEFAPIMEALKNISCEIDAYRILKHFTAMPGTCKAVWQSTTRSATEWTPFRKPTVTDGPNGMPSAAELEKLRADPETKMSPAVSEIADWHDLVYVEGVLLRDCFYKVMGDQISDKPDQLFRTIIGLVGGVEDSEEYRQTYLNVFHTKGKERCKDPDRVAELENQTFCTGLAHPGAFKNQHWYNCLTCSLNLGLGCCEPCLFKCHVGHVVRPRFGGFSCDCSDNGTTWACKFHDKPGAKPVENNKVRANAFKIKLPQKKVPKPVEVAPAKVDTEVQVDPKNKPRESTILSRVGWILKNASEIPGPAKLLDLEKWKQLVSAAWKNDAKTAKSIIADYFASLSDGDITRWRMLTTPLDKCKNPPQLVSVAAASPKGVGACIAIVKILGLEYQRLKSMVNAAIDANEEKLLAILQQEAELCAVYWSDMAYHALNIIGMGPAKIYGLEEHMSFSIVYQDKSATEKTVPAWDDFHSLWPKGALHGVLKMFETGSHGWSELVSCLLQIPAFAELLIYRCILAYSSSVQDVFQQVLSNPNLALRVDWKHVLRVLCSLTPEAGHMEKFCNAIAIEAGLAPRGARDLSGAFTKLFPDIPLSYLVECADQCPNQLVFQQITKTLVDNKLATQDQFDSTKQRSNEVMNALEPAESMLGFPSATAREEWIKSTTVTKPHQLKAAIDAENAEWNELIESFNKASPELVRAFGASKPVHRVIPAKISESPLRTVTCDDILPGSKPTHLVLKQQQAAPAAASAPTKATSSQAQQTEKVAAPAPTAQVQSQPAPAPASNVAADKPEKKKKKGLFSKLKSAFK